MDTVSCSYSSIIQEPSCYFSLFTVCGVAVETGSIAHLENVVFFSTFNGRPSKLLSTIFVRRRRCRSRIKFKGVAADLATIPKVVGLGAFFPHFRRRRLLPYQSPYPSEKVFRVSPLWTPLLPIKDLQRSHSLTPTTPPSRRLVPLLLPPPSILPLGNSRPS